jgi:hypothetical protein
MAAIIRGMATVILHLRAVHNAQHEKGILEVSSISSSGVTPSPLPLLDTEACPPVYIEEVIEYRRQGSY